MFHKIKSKFKINKLFTTKKYPKTCLKIKKTFHLDLRYSDAENSNSVTGII